MAIFKPVIKEFSNETNKFLGICKFAILDFEDKSGTFDWADLYLEVEVKQEHGDYNRKLQIKGSLEKEKGKIVGGSVLKRLYTFFDAIGCPAGINVDGGWEDGNGKSIEDIKDYLTDSYIAEGNSNYEPTEYPYIAYFYKEQPKKPGAKAYTTVWPKVYKYTEDNEAKLHKDITWLKGKGYLKELTDEVKNAPSMTGNGLSNL